MAAGALVEVETGTEAVVRGTGDVFDVLEAAEAVLEEFQHALRRVCGDRGQWKWIRCRSSRLTVDRPAPHARIGLCRSCRNHQYSDDKRRRLLSERHVSSPCSEPHEGAPDSVKEDCER